MLSRLYQNSLQKSFIVNRQVVRSASVIISKNDRSSLIQNNQTTSKVYVVSPITVPVRYRRFDGKNFPKDGNNPEEIEESQNVRAVYDVKSNPDNTSSAG